VPRLLDRILVIDVESTCWERGREPAGAESEIIEIGVAEVDVARRPQYRQNTFLAAVCRPPLIPATGCRQ
jgi:hypothetical protein